MKDNYILTAESVTAGHPDKLCDTIADNVLDACLKEDPNARVACEVLATAGKILVAGELRTTASPDVETIVRQVVQNAGYDCNYHVEVRLHTQSPDIAGAVDGDTLGAGDQGIMYGYACWETVELLPAPVVLANRITSLLTTCREEKLISGIGPDGKAQVSVQYAFGVPERVDTIVIPPASMTRTKILTSCARNSAGWSLPVPATTCASTSRRRFSSIRPAGLCWAALKPTPVSPAVS